MSQIFGYMLLVLQVLHGYRTGPPTSVCSSMMPDHGGTTQTANLSAISPFYIALTATSYRQGQNVTVNITTFDLETPFKGFLLQARIADTFTDTPTGRFYAMDGDSEVRLMSCSGGNSNAVSHISPVPNTLKQFTWVSETGGNVYFQTTFVKEKLIYWTGIRSKTLTDEALTTNPTTPPTTSVTTIPGQATFPSSSQTALCPAWSVLELAILWTAITY